MTPISRSHECHMTSPDLKLLYLLMEKGQDIHLPARFFLHTLHAVVPEFTHKDEKTGESCDLVGGSHVTCCHGH